MNDFIRKISSRKLWVALAGIAAGIAMVLGVSESDISTVAGTVLTLTSAVTYIFTEGKIDSERVKTAAESVREAVNAVEGGDKNAG